MTDIYMEWLQDLLEAIDNNKLLKKYTNVTISLCTLDNKPLEESYIQVVDNRYDDKSLLIDSNNFRKYFEAVVEPRYTYQESIKDASELCVKFIKEWTVE